MSDLREEVDRDLRATRSLAREDEFAGPFALLAERRHPLVAAERRRARGSNRALLALCLGIPLAGFLAAAVAMLGSAETYYWSRSLPGRILPPALVVFAAVWPLAMILGAAWRSAGASLAERSGDTALQLVLTLVRKRTIAAAKVLPYCRPFLWGVVGALPVYLLAGSTEAIMFGGDYPAPWLVWPLRFLAAAAALSGHNSLPEWSPGGAAAGLLMAVTDLGLVWIAAHWAAGLAVRTTSLPSVGFRIALRLLESGLMFAVYLFLAFILALMAYLLGRWLISHGEATAVLCAAATFLGLGWFFPLRHAVRGCLEDFAQFDRLAMDAEEAEEEERHRPLYLWWYDGWRT